MESIEVLENELSVVDDDDGIGEELTVNHDLSHHDTDTSLVTASDGASLVVDHDSTSDHGLEIEEGDTNNTVSGTECLSVIGSSGITTISQITSEQVIGLGLLLQNEKEEKNAPDEGNLEVPQMLQAVTFPDGTTAFIQHNKDLKLTEGQTLTLEDGTTAVVQNTVTTTKEVTPEASEENKVVEGQAIQLDDGTMAYLQTTKGPDGLQAITLEDGTTAYIAHPNPESLFVETAGLDGTLPNMEHISQVTGNTDLTEESEIKQEIIDKGIIRMVDGDDQERNVPFGDKAFRCMYGNCGRLYTTLHHLKVHERSHTGDRPFKCDFIQCGKAFATGYGLKSHRRVHTGEKPYKCQENGCDKAFKTSGDLQKHVRTHTGERPFKCPFEGCTRSFTTSNIRKVHIRTHTGERPYNCTEEGCGRSFASATNYKNHVRIHTGEKPYVCTVTGCGKRFTEYSSLYKHHVVHTHSKPYECGHCGKTYRQTSTLAMHKRTAHGEEVTAVIGDAETAQLFAQEGESDEPDSKRTRLQFINSDNTEDGEGMLVINTSQSSQQVGDLEAVRLIPEDESQTIQVSLPCLQQLQQQHTISGFTVNEQGQQVLVVTDPIQLEHLQASLQQIAGQIGTTASLSITVGPTELTNNGTASVSIASDSVSVANDSVSVVSDSVSIVNDSVSVASESVTKPENTIPTTTSSETTDTQSTEISIKAE